MISKEFLKEKGVEEKYQEAIRRIQRHQQSAQLSYEIIFWVILGGLGINLIASTIYDIAIEWNILRHEIFVISFIFMIGLFLLSYGKFIDFKPKQRVQFAIEYRLQDRKDFGLKINDILLYLNEGKFTREDFILWYDSFKNELINNKAIVFTHSFDFKYKADMDSMHGKVFARARTKT